MAANISDLKREAGKLYKRLERQAFDTVNKREDIERYNFLINEIDYNAAATRLNNKIVIQQIKNDLAR